LAINTASFPNRLNSCKAFTASSLVIPKDLPSCLTCDPLIFELIPISCISLFNSLIDFLKSRVCCICWAIAVPTIDRPKPNPPPKAPPAKPPIPPPAAPNPPWPNNNGKPPPIKPLLKAPLTLCPLVAAKAPPSANWLLKFNPLAKEPIVGILPPIRPPPTPAVIWSALWLNALNPPIPGLTFANWFCLNNLVRSANSCFNAFLRNKINFFSFASIFLLALSLKSAICCSDIFLFCKVCCILCSTFTDWPVKDNDLKPSPILDSWLSLIFLKTFVLSATWPNLSGVGVFRVKNFGLILDLWLSATFLLTLLPLEDWATPNLLVSICFKIRASSANSLFNAFCVLKNTSAALLNDVVPTAAFFKAVLALLTDSVRLFMVFGNLFALVSSALLKPLTSWVTAFISFLSFNNSFAPFKATAISTL